MIGILFRPLHVRLPRQLAHRGSLSALLTLFLIFFTVLLPAMLAVEAPAVFQRVHSAELHAGAVIEWLQALVPQTSDWAAGVGIDGLPQKLSEAAVNGSRFITSPALPAWHRPHDVLTS